MKIEFTPKQKQVWRESVTGTPQRWNLSIGATRSGKTYLDYFKIPYRVRNAPDGLILLLGNTRGTLERNILEPMRRIWTPVLVGYITSRSTVHLFGRECYAIGADKINQVSKLQGAGFSYVYGDEMSTWHEDVFQMLKSRIDRPGARFDGTSNPDHPKHWLKSFLDSAADIYLMRFRLDDNTIYARDNPDFIESLKREYAGTVWYHRLVLGEWVAAEGAIYQIFANDPKAFTVDAPRDLMEINVGVDFGGGQSGHAFVATGITRGYGRLVVLASERHVRRPESADIDPEALGQLFVTFCRNIAERYGVIHNVYCDSAEQTLIAGLRSSARTLGLGWLVPAIGNALKTSINDRIRAAIRLMAQNRFAVVRGECATVEDALTSALWNPRALTKDERLDDGTTDIDSLDAMEYTFERSISQLMRYRG